MNCKLERLVRISWLVCAAEKRRTTMAKAPHIKCPSCRKENFHQDGFETLTEREFEAHFQCEDCNATFCVRGSVLEIEQT
jgi:transposase-like protein